MLKNYIKTAWRNLLRHKVFALINIAGLAIGISAALVIYLIVYFDFSFDKFEPDNNRIYRVVSDMNFTGTAIYSSGVQAPLAGAVKSEVTGISTVAAFHQLDDDAKITIPNNGDVSNKVFKKQKNAIFADQNYFSLINYQWLVGTAAGSLTQPNQLVLTEQRAGVLFPNLPLADVIGRQVVYNDTVRTTISGIVKALDQHSDFIFTDFISLSTIPNSGLKEYYSWTNWGMTNGSSQLYVKLAPGSTAQQVERQLVAIEKKYNKKPANSKSGTTYKLQPLADLHFNAQYPIYGDHVANKQTLYGLLTIAAFLLLLGCINFINLSTAQATHRAKEIGIRKTMGSTKTQLMFQFLSETFLVTVLASLLSVGLTPVILKSFSSFIPAGVVFDPLQLQIIIFLILLAVVVTCLAGFYPARVLAQYKPIAVLKNQAFADGKQTRKTWIRKTLTIFQFLIAQVFIMATFIVAKQIHYTLNQDMGFKKDAIVYFQTPYGDKTPANKALLMDKLRLIPEIDMISLGGSTPASGGSWTGPAKYKDGKKEIEMQMQMKQGDVNYLNLYHIKLVAGRNLRATEPEKGVIVNQTYTNMLGFKNPADAIGKFIERDDEKRPIVGVLADFHQASFRQNIKPVLYTLSDNYSHTIHIALKPQNSDGSNWKNALSKMETAYKQVYPDVDFDYSFYDKKIEGFYQNEQNTSSLLRWATVLAVFISCLGLLGLVIFTTNQRTKEIGIRKVLGASVAHIVSILSVDFVKLVLVSFVIAAPIAWLGMNKWLQNFAYRTSVNWWIFALSGLLMVIIALITLSFQTIKAAIANPVKSLKNE